MTPTWQPPGPVAQAFAESQDPISVIMGPVGGGKTTAALWRGIYAAYAWPETAPGLRQVKFGVVRRLYKDLEKTTIPSWTRWFPRTMGVWRGAAGDPATHDLVLAHPAGGRIELRVEFMALGELRVEEALRGYEPSFIFVDEVDTAPEDILEFSYQRAGRYPSATLARNPKMVWGACNAPEEGNWIVRDFIDEPRPNWTLYVQPSGLSDRAENLAVLGPHYYRQMAETMRPFQRKRFIENIPGLSQAAEAVYADDFDPDRMVAPEPLAPIPGRPLIVGMDAGGTPAAVIMQHAANGQRRILAELSTHAKEHGSITGPTRFGEVLAELLASERFRGHRARGIADPSAAYGADRARGEASWIETVARVAAIPVTAAPTNDPTVRQEALRWPMLRLIDARTPAFLVCPTCRLIKRALTSDYRFVVTAGRRTAHVLKNWASHLVEAAQYAALDGGAYHEVIARQTARTAGFRPAIAETRFNPFAPGAFRP